MVVERYSYIRSRDESDSQTNIGRRIHTSEEVYPLAHVNSEVYKPDSLSVQEAEIQSHNICLERGQDIKIKDLQSGKIASLQRVNNLRIRIRGVDNSTKPPRIALEDGEARVEEFEGKAMEVTALGFVAGGKREFSLALEDGLEIVPEPKKA